MMFSWLKYRRSFISRSVRRQNMEWSKGVIFLIATFWPDGLWMAELAWKRVREPKSKDKIVRELSRATYQTTPYAPSPTTS
jgi:hypothetical protein